jgi:hypothetical protein
VQEPCIHCEVQIGRHFSIAFLPNSTIEIKRMQRGEVFSWKGNVYNKYSNESNMQIMLYGLCCFKGQCDPLCHFICHVDVGRPFLCSPLVGRFPLQGILETIKDEWEFLHKSHTYLSHSKSHSQGKGCNQNNRELFPPEGISWIQAHNSHCKQSEDSEENQIGISGCSDISIVFQ